MEERINSIKWHKNRFNNTLRYVKDKEKQLQIDLNNLNDYFIRLLFLKVQIDTAEKENKETFDGDKYLVSKKKSKSEIIAEKDKPFLVCGVQYTFPKKYE